MDIPSGQAPIVEACVPKTAEFKQWWRTKGREMFPEDMIDALASVFLDIGEIRQKTIDDAWQEGYDEGCMDTQDDYEAEKLLDDDDFTDED